MFEAEPLLVLSYGYNFDVHVIATLVSNYQETLGLIYNGIKIVLNHRRYLIRPKLRYIDKGNSSGP